MARALRLPDLLACPRTSCSALSTANPGDLQQRADPAGNSFATTISTRGEMFVFESYDAFGRCLAQDRRFAETG